MAEHRNKLLVVEDGMEINPEGEKCKSWIKSHLGSGMGYSPESNGKRGQQGKRSSSSEVLKKNSRDGRAGR